MIIAITTLKDELLEIYDFLYDLTNINNKKGIYRNFIEWVIENWSTNEFYDTEEVDAGYDCSYHPRRTGERLKNKVKLYQDFIHSNTGQTVATYCSGSGISTEEYYEILTNYLEEYIREQTFNFIKKRDYKIPDDYKLRFEIDSEDETPEIIFEAITEDAFLNKEEEEIARSIQEMIFGYFIHGDYVPSPLGNNEYAKNKFSNWTLDKFKEEYLILVMEN